MTTTELLLQRMRPNRVASKLLCAIALFCGSDAGTQGEDVPPGRRPETYWSDPNVIALANAITVADIKKIDELVAKGADVNARGKQDATLLVWSVARQRKDAFKRLLEHGADSSADFAHYGSVLHFCARAENSSDWLRIALEHGGNANLGESGENTPIFSAISSRRKDNLDLLIKAGADLNHHGNGGDSPIVYAASLNWFDSVYYLLEAGADYRLRDNYAYDLRYEVMDTSVAPKLPLGMWREKVVQWLVENGIDFREAEDKIGRIRRIRDVMRQWEDEQKARASRWTSTDPMNARDFRLRAAGWRILKEWDKALADFDEAVRLEPKQAGSYRQRADIHWWLSARSLLGGGSHEEELEKAIADYSTAIALDPRDAESRLRRAHLWWNKNEYEKAFADCDDAVRLDDRFAQAYVDRGKFRADRATYDFRARSSPLRGDQRHLAAELDKAIADYGEALRADRLCLDAYDHRAMARIYKGEYSKAVEELTQAIRLAKTNPRFYSARADAYKYVGDLDAATADLGEAIRLGGPHPEHAYEARGDILLQKKEYDRAVADFDQAIRLSPGGIFANRKRRQAWNALGQFDKSIEDLRESIAADPDASWLHAELARLLIACPDASCRDPNKALEHAVKAYELDEWKDAETISLLANAYAESGNFEAAVRWQQKAIEKAESDEQRGAFRRRLDAYKRREKYGEEPRE